MPKQLLLAEADSIEFPSQGTLIDRAGLPLDASGWTWHLHHAVRSVNLNFRGLEFNSISILRSTAKFLADLIATSSTDDVKNHLEALAYLKCSPHFREVERTGDTIDERLFADLKNTRAFQHWRLHYIRAWYRWCATNELPQFSLDVAHRLQEMRVGSNEVGRAVRTRDPIQGAFDELEFIALTTKLRAVGRDILDPSQYALCWLAIALGCNPLAFALMRESDFKPVKEVGTKRIYARIDVPRIKKGDVHHRSQFHPKMLNDEIGIAVARAIQFNKTKRQERGWIDGCELPMFPRQAPVSRKLGGPLQAFAMHLDSSEITETIQKAIAKLEIVSHRTGEPLVVNSRRFRRTYGTRAVEEGASPTELALMLDHSDIGTVQAYFETRSSQVPRLDAAVALKLGPIADAFMGKIVRSEREAVNGDKPGKRIPWYRRHPDQLPEKNGSLGTCGSGPCSLFAPVSCYTCAKFQPWRDAPHREVLDWLCAERELKQKEGLDPQIVGIHDTTILAVAEVVKACEVAQ